MGFTLRAQSPMLMSTLQLVSGGVAELKALMEQVQQPLSMWQ